MSVLTSPFQQRFLKEASVWRNLTHPFILPFLGIFIYQGYFYLVSPFVENGALPSYLAKHPEADRPRLVSTISSGERD